MSGVKESFPAPGLRVAVRLILAETRGARVTLIPSPSGVATPWRWRGAVADTTLRLGGLRTVAETRGARVMPPPPLSGEFRRVEPGREHRDGDAVRAPRRLLLVRGVAPCDFLRAAL